LFVLSACTHAQAKTAPEAPLEMPAPPERDVEPTDAATPAPMPLVQEPARSTPPRPRPAPPQPARTEPPKVDAAKPEAAPAEPAKPVVEDAPKPPPTLQTAPATVEGEVERGIRTTLTKATAELNRVDYRALNADARTQYDTAKRFIGQADEAMRAKNLVLAKNLAEKAATLAAQLGGR
jgi:hypothetical protein